MSCFQLGLVMFLHCRGGLLVLECLGHWSIGGKYCCAVSKNSNSSHVVKQSEELGGIVRDYEALSNS